MKRLLRLTLYAGSAAAGGIILWGAGSASATDGDDGGGSAGAGTGQVQEAVVDNATTQGGTAEIANTQINLNAPIAIASPGANSGGTSQTNDAGNTAAVVNSNSTEQSVDQSQNGSATASGGDATGGGDGGDGTAVVDQGQSAGVSNDTDQSGDAMVENRQINVNLPVAVLSPGANSGPVEQSNEADNTAVVENDNTTDQSVAQSQSGDATASGGDAGGDPCNPCGGHGGDGGDAGALVEQEQVADVGNGTSQGGSATVDNSQDNANGAAPHAAPAPALPSAPAAAANSGGDCGCQPPPPPPPPPAVGGPVDQSNAADNEAGVGNVNDTTQSVEQSQDGTATATGGNARGDGDGGDATAIVDQDQWAGVGNETDQNGDASVSNDQVNLNAPIAIGSHGANGGPVNQSNDADNSAVVLNGNSTDQSVGQSQSGDSTASGGDASGGGRPCGCEPSATTFSGGGGDHPCGCDHNRRGGDAGDGTAIVDQSQWAEVGNGTSQGGSATVDNRQENANGAAPRLTLVRENGGGGWYPAPAGEVSQSNEAVNGAGVGNFNDTSQAVEQSQDGSATATGGNASGGGDAGDGTAVVYQGQSAGVGNETSQDGDAAIRSAQRNVNAPASSGPHKDGPSKDTRCGCHPPTPARSGPVDQSNAADNAAVVVNHNSTDQSVGQSQAADATATGGDATGGRHHRCGCNPPPKPPPKGDDGRCGCEHDREGDHGNKGGKGVWPIPIALPLLHAV